mgnify:CR=1 FL=1
MYEYRQQHRSLVDENMGLTCHIPQCQTVGLVSSVSQPSVTVLHFSVIIRLVKLLWVWSSRVTLNSHTCWTSLRLTKLKHTRSSMVLYSRLPNCINHLLLLQAKIPHHEIFYWWSKYIFSEPLTKMFQTVLKRILNIVRHYLIEYDQPCPNCITSS